MNLTRSYATSRFRILLLAAMIGAVVLMAASGFAQDAGTGTETRAPVKGLFSLVFSHPEDPLFWLIGALSITGLTLIIQGFMKNRANVLMPEATTNRIREMIGMRQFKELIDFTENDPSFISKAINPALKRAPSFSSMKEAMETAIGEQTAEQFRKIELLNIIGNLGPLLGLLGTVMGMIGAFQGVASTKGQADVSVLSDGISTALTHTFLGLFLAVPCLAAFGILRTIVDRLTVRAALVSEELLLMIKPAEPKPGMLPSAMASRAGTAVPQPAGIPRKTPSPIPAPSHPQM